MKLSSAFRTIVFLLQVLVAFSAKRKSGLGVQILEKAIVCPQKAKVGDHLKVHYSGTLKDGTEFDETYKVGRPEDVYLGQGQVIKGWEEGLVGMCVGEKRRLTVPAKLGYGSEGGGRGGRVPPGATMYFQIELVSLNGKQLIQMQAEAEAKETLAADRKKSIEETLLTRAGKKDSPYCDGCNTFVEQFYETWVKMLKSQESKVETKDGGSSAPALTYDDDVEATVQQFCTNRTISAIARPNIYADHIQPACEKIMLGHKREIVGKFMGSVLEGRLVLDKKDQVCADMVAACPHSQGKVEQGSCDFCKAVMDDIGFELRRGPDSQLPRNENAKKKVFRILDTVCIRTYYRHRFKSSTLQEACEEFLDDNGGIVADEIVNVLQKKKKWDDLKRELCVERSGMCPASAFPEDEPSVEELSDEAYFISKEEL